MENRPEPPAPSLIWWIRQILLTLVGCFFLLFGVQILIGAYGLNDPFSFILTFFASNLIILISAVLIIGFIYRMVRFRRAWKKDPEP
ncbi:MAG: hypothetical protein ACOC3W_07460 [Thermodesulfobacteriota bacterium]